MSDTETGQGADLITISDVAAILAVSKSAANRIAAAEDFPRPFRFNARTVKYSKAEIIEWVQSKKE